MIAVLAGLMVLAPGMDNQACTGRKDALCIAEIRQVNTEQMVEFQGFVINNAEEPMTGNYTLEAIREGVSGKSVSQQAGKFSLDNGKESGLSRISINVDDKDKIKVILKIYTEDILMCADSIVRPVITNNDL